MKLHTLLILLTFKYCHKKISKHVGMHHLQSLHNTYLSKKSTLKARFGFKYVRCTFKFKFKLQNKIK